MQQPMYQPPQPEKPRRRRGGFARFMRGYLMLVGAGTSLYVLVQLIIRLLVELQKWMATPPIS